MSKTQIAMTDEQWNTVIDAVNDKYPDSDCLDILINNVRHFPSFLVKYSDVNYKELTPFEEELEIQKYIRDNPN